AVPFAAGGEDEILPAWVPERRPVHVFIVGEAVLVEYADRERASAVPVHLEVGDTELEQGVTAWLGAIADAVARWGEERTPGISRPRDMDKIALVLEVVDVNVQVARERIDLLRIILAPAVGRVSAFSAVALAPADDRVNHEGVAAESLSHLLGV